MSETPTTDPAVETSELQAPDRREPETPPKPETPEEGYFKRQYDKLIKKLNDYEQADEDRKKAEIAEIERVRQENETLASEVTSLKGTITQIRVRGSIDAVTSELGCLYPDLVVEKIDLDKIEYGEDGTPVKESIARLVEPIKSAYPALFKSAPQTDLGIRGNPPTQFDPNNATPEEAAEWYRKNFAR